MTSATQRPPPADERDLAGTPALAIDGLSRGFGGPPVVDGLSLEVRPGEVVALLGPSGCGKTTTLRLIAGFERPDAGSIRIAGRVVADGTRHVPPERRRVGMVFQEYALFPHLTVAENVVFGLDRGRERAARVAALLDLVGLTGAGERNPGELSGGQQQRVAVARALAPRPTLLLLDEPFSNLDQALRVQLRGEIRGILRAAGATAILVTHDQDEAVAVADRVGVMLGGRLRQIGTPAAIHQCPADREVATFVGEATFLPGTASGDRAATALGPLPLDRPVVGRVDVLIRPEMLRIMDTGAPSSAEATVIALDFAGPDRIVTVRLAAGPVVGARVSSYRAISVGDIVGIVVRGPIVAFPAPPGPSGTRAPGT